MSLQKSKLTSGGIAVLLAMLLLACDPGHTESAALTGGQGTGQEQPKLPEETEPPVDVPVEGQPTLLDYATVNAEVILPECVKCHSTDGRAFSLETYADVLLAINEIEREVAAGTMPPRSVLSDEDKKLLLDWIAAGAPETVTILPFNIF